MAGPLAAKPNGRQLGSVKKNYRDPSHGWMERHARNNCYRWSRPVIITRLDWKHCHLDKSKLGTPWRPVTPAANLVERFETEIPQLDALPLSIKERAQQLIDLELPHGVVSFRSHIDIEPMTELRYFDALTELLADKPFGSNLFCSRNTVRCDQMPSH